MTDVTIQAGNLGSTAPIAESGAATVFSSHPAGLNGAQQPFATVLDGMTAMPTLQSAVGPPGSPFDRQGLAERGKALPEAAPSAALGVQPSLVAHALPATRSEMAAAVEEVLESMPSPHATGRDTAEPHVARQPGQLLSDTLTAAERGYGAHGSGAPGAKLGVGLEDGRTAAVTQDTEAVRGAVATAPSPLSPAQPSGSTESSAPVARLVVPNSPDSPSWQEGFSSRVAWMVRDGTQLAELRIRPPEMGFIEVRIAVSQQEASIAFAAQHLAVRDAIESALPRLREMLSEGGIALGNVDVSEHNFGRESRAPFTTSPQSQDWWDPGNDAVEPASLPQHAGIHQGLVDRYA